MAEGLNSLPGVELRKYKITIGTGRFYLGYFMGIFNFIFEKFGTEIFHNVLFEGFSFPH